ncbi:hypothetical protein BP00DRAFT_208996 [Aspergillus indologenus CBS 114.80]|uniref:Uncharacterized protein n=1 Tax=Aspergillus indologenus CBS 114.80 TaxID=1450541 RepID=A0A2V5J0B9_9EURO|nr:hypothetical protein BP00DRAFT_208996 [Aspergillus indologenus CBS 114.80]
MTVLLSWLALWSSQVRAEVASGPRLRGLLLRRVGCAGTVLLLNTSSNSSSSGSSDGAARWKRHVHCILPLLLHLHLQCWSSAAVTGVGALIKRKEDSSRLPSETGTSLSKNEHCSLWNVQDNSSNSYLSPSHSLIPGMSQCFNPLDCQATITCPWFSLYLHHLPCPNTPEKRKSGIKEYGLVSNNIHGTNVAKEVGQTKTITTPVE